MTTKKKTKEGAVEKAVGRKRLKLGSDVNMGDAGQSVDQETGQDTTATSGPEFQYIPLSGIAVMEQVRSNINTTTDSFQALMQSIKDRGILEPLLVTAADDGGPCTLLCGERRFMAAQQLGLETVPVRVMDAVTQRDEIIAFQLTENLQREDLNPIDQAQGILSYIQAKLPDKNYDVDGVMSDLVSYDRRPEGVSPEFAATVAAILQISGKSTKTLFNGLSLLKLPYQIRIPIAEGTLPVSQGYLFAANLDCPDLLKIFEDILKKPVTNAILTNLLTAWKKTKPDPNKPKPLLQQVKSIQAATTAVGQTDRIYKTADLQKLLEALQAYVAVVQQRIQAAPSDNSAMPLGARAKAVK